MQAQFGQVLVEPDEEYNSGLLSDETKLRRGKVLNVGPGQMTGTGMVVKPRLSAGDTVFYYGGQEFTVGERAFVSVSMYGVHVKLTPEGCMVEGIQFEDTRNESLGVSGRAKAVDPKGSSPGRSG